MSRLIDADKAIDDLKQFTYDCNFENIGGVLEVIRVLEQQPTFDIEKVVGQYKWERDVAISQLEKLGIGFGEKIEDEVIKKVKEVMNNV